MQIHGVLNITVFIEVPLHCLLFSIGSNNWRYLSNSSSEMYLVIKSIAQFCLLALSHSAVPLSCANVWDKQLIQSSSTETGHLPPLISSPFPLPERESE